MKQFHISEVFIFLNVLFEEGRVVRLFISWIKPTLINRLKGRVSPDFRQQFFYEINTPDKQTKVFLTFDSISPISPYRDSVTRFFIICFA